jgi:hypothetical protein
MVRAMLISSEGKEVVVLNGTGTMVWDTLEGITARKDLWILIRECILNNPDFPKALNASQKTSFYLRS